MAAPGVNNRKRLLTLLGAFSVILLGLLVFRVGYWQLVKSEWLQIKASDQWTREVPVAAERGDILDRNGNVLASSASCDAVILRPSQIKDPDAVADQLSLILEMDRQTVYERATSKYSERWLKRQITAEQADQILELNMDGVVLVEDKKRYYPMGNFLTQVLGFTSVDGEGLEGLESRFDKYLKGTPGLVATEADGAGRELPYNADEYVAPVDGDDLVLTIDWTIQSFLEKNAEQCLLEQNAKRVCAIAMDPDTGEILGMTTKPDYDNNEPPRSDITLLQQLTRNMAISDSYEPGSTFKIVTLASALDSGAVNMDSSFNCMGYRLIDGEKIKCWRTIPHGVQTLTEAAQNSCNPAFMDMALAMGTQTFYDYLYKFGLGGTTGIELYGEGAGIVTPIKYVRNVDLARIGFGQAIAVTPLQLVTAVSAAINGGVLMQPHIVKEIRDDNGNVVLSYEPEALEQVISPQTSQQVREILEAVVENGSGRNARIEGYRVGGKTGTAQKYDENGNVMHDVHISSFLGFAPADDPRVVVLMVVDEPHSGIDFGSIVAAPYVKNVLEETLQYMNVPRQNVDGGTGVMKEVPDVREMEVEQAIAALQSEGFDYLVEGYSGQVVQQMPPPGTEAEEDSIVMIYLEDEDPQSSDEYFVTVPDVMGKNAIEANELLEQSGLHVKFSGPGGVVVSQSPAANETAFEGDTVTLVLDYPQQNDD